MPGSVFLNVAQANPPITNAATPLFSPGSGTYTGVQSVAISCTTPGATVYYTTDGSTPTILSTVYSGPVTVSSTQVLKALAIASGFGPSAIGSAAYTIAPSTSGQYIKFVSGDWFVSEDTYNTSVAQAMTEIDVFAANPMPGPVQVYCCGMRWGRLETASSNLNDPTNILAQYGGFADIATIFNYLQSKIPGAYMMLFVNGVVTGGNLTASFITSHNFGQSNNYLPQDIVKCGGSLTVPTYYGSPSSNTYPVAPIYAGSSYYGISFSGINGNSPPGFVNTLPQWFNPGVNARWMQLHQALSMYSFTVTAGPLAGQTLTLDGNKLFLMGGSNDEYSYACQSSQNIAGVTVNPPATVSGAAPTAANFFAAQKAWGTAVTGFFPHMPWLANMSYGYGGTTSDTPANMAGYVNNAITGNGLSSISGMGFCSSDTYGLDWVTPYDANPAKQGFMGIGPPNNSYGGTGTLPSANFASLEGNGLWVAQIQPTDYQTKMPGGSGNYRTQAAVAYLMQSANYMGVPIRMWNCADGTTFGTTAWTTYVQAGIAANQSSYPVSPYLPQSLMQAPISLSATINSSSSVTLNWLQQNGVSWEYSVDGGAWSSPITPSTVTITGLTSAAHLFAVRMSNVNGSGPASTVAANTTLTIGINASGQFVNSAGVPINLRGVNVGGSEYCLGGTNFWAGESWPSTPDMTTLATFKANVVRFTISTQSILGQTTLLLASCLPASTASGTYAVPTTLPGGATQISCDADGQFTAKLKAAVDMFTAAGYYVILDIHFCGPDVLIGGTTYHVHNNGSAAQMQMPDSVWAPLALNKLATQYAGYTNVMIDCYNEPGSTGTLTWSQWLNGTTYTTIPVQDYVGPANVGTFYTFTYAAGWQSAGMQQLVTAIRNGGFTGPIICGGLEYGTELGNNGFADTTSTWLLSKPVDPLNKLVASLHLYSGYNFRNNATVSSGSANIAVTNNGTTSNGGTAPSILGIGSFVTFNTTVGNFIGGTTYYVVAATATSMQLSATLGGSAMTATANGTPIIQSSYGGGNYAYFYNSDNNPLGSAGFRQWVAWVNTINAANIPCIAGEYGGINTPGLTVEPFVSDLLAQIDAINNAKTGSIGALLGMYGVPSPPAPISINPSTGVATVSGPTGTVSFNWSSGHAAP